VIHSRTMAGAPAAASSLATGSGNQDLAVEAPEKLDVLQQD
jgi:hypothetical protein